jgi:hypothetical protein
VTKLGAPQRYRQLAALAAMAGVCLPSCNPIWGLEERPLLSDASSPAADTTTPDGGAEASDGGPSCAAPLASDASAVCPPLEGGACGPQNLVMAPFAFVAPTKPNNQCSPAQLEAAVSACLSGQSTSTTCSAWKNQSTANAACFGCLFSDLGAPTYGAYFVYPGDYATFNNAGCVMLLDPCWEPCARVFESYVDCRYNACASSCETFAAIDACKPQADKCACAAESEDDIACENAITASRSPAAACLTTNQDSIDAFLGLFCGAPDGG